MFNIFFFFFSSRRRHTRSDRDWSSDVCSSDLSHEQEARDAIAMLEPLAAQSRSPVLEIDLRFARALVADDREAELLFQAAISEDTSLPLMVARSQLAYGIWLRRQRRVAESRAPLRAAREAFLAIGATPLAERARRELRASGENSPRRLPRASDRLT